MAEEKITSFSIDVGPQHQLPIDKSLNSFCSELGADYKDCEGPPPTRKLLQGALSALPFDGKPIEDSRKTLYDKLLENRYDDINYNRNTTPCAVYWECQDLIKAICKARHDNQTLRDLLLAKEALDILIDDIKHRPINDLTVSYARFQLLQEPYVRSRLIESFSDSLTSRMGLIYSLAAMQTDNVAIENMPKALMAFDSLIVDLLETATLPQPFLSPMRALCSYYNRLEMARPKVERDTNIIKFEVTDPSFPLEELRDHLTQLLQITEGHKKGSANQQLLQETEQLFEQYLRARIEVEFPKEFEEVKTFVEKYSKLSNYVFSDYDWNDIEAELRKKLFERINAAFKEAEELHYTLDYYLETLASDSVTTAFISTQCKITCDYIIKLLYHPLRLLQEHACFCKYYGGMDEDFVWFQSESALSDWISKAKTARATLSESCPSIQLLTQSCRKLTTGFVNQYNSIVPKRMNCPSLIEMEVYSAQHESAGKLISVKQINSLAYIMKLECQLIACTLAEDSILRAQKKYETYQKTYDRDIL